MDFELYINWGVVGIIILIALVIALLAANIKVVPQARRRTHSSLKDSARTTPRGARACI